MFARWQSERVQVRTVVCFALAFAAHVTVLAVARRPAIRISDALLFFDGIVETPALANVDARRPPAIAPPEAPPPAEPPRPTPPSSAPARRASAGDPYEPPPTSLQDRGREAAAAVVAAARSVLTGDDTSADDFATRNDDAGPGFGLVAGDGVSNTATLDRGAVIGGGLLGGTGTAPHGRAGHAGDGDQDEGPDHSRPSHVIGGLAGDCAFPNAATGIDEAVVVIVVSVRKNGSAADVVVASDPGHGFGAAARACALRRRYEPALDRHGRPVASITPLINVRFTR